MTDKDLRDALQSDGLGWVRCGGQVCLGDVTGDHASGAESTLWMRSAREQADREGLTADQFAHMMRLKVESP